MTKPSLATRPPGLFQPLEWMLRKRPAEIRSDPSFQLGYRPALDGLRGVAVLAILVYHTPLNQFFVGGFLGVDLFLVLSGFLITCLLVEEHCRHGSISLRKFYGRRILRLFPALWVMVAACCLLGLLAWKHGVGPKILQPAALTLCCSANWYWYFGTDLFLLGHTWSLGLEEQFYVLWPPLLAFLLSFRLRRRWVLLIVGLGIVGAAMARATIWRGPETLSYHIATTSLATRADAMLAGCLVGLLACWNCLPRLGLGRLAMQSAGGAAAALLICLTVTVRLGDTALYYGLFTVAAAAAAIVIAAVVSEPPRFVLLTLGAPSLAGIGKIAYGLYLWHLPVFLLFDPVVARLSPSFLNAPALCWFLKSASTLAAALLSFHLVERPFLRWKARLARA